MYEEGPMWWLRATSCPAPHPGSEDLPRCHLRLRRRQRPARRGVEAATRDHRGSHGQWHLVWREPAARLRVIVLGDLHRALRPFLPVQPVQPVQSSAAAAASRPHSSADSDSDDSACSRRPLHDGANQPLTHLSSAWGSIRSPKCRRKGSQTPFLLNCRRPCWGGAPHSRTVTSLILPKLVLAAPPPPS